jgi:hypothetical protein
MYVFYLDGMLLPVTPGKLKTKINNKNDTIDLISLGEINRLKSPGLSEIEFEALLPNIQYPFAMYIDGFKSANYYLERLEVLKNSKKPFRFICCRLSQGGKYLYDTNKNVSLEEYEINEDADELGLDLMVTVNLKEFKHYGVKYYNANGGLIDTKSSTNKDAAKTYKVQEGDTIWLIAKKVYGDGNKCMDIYNVNKTDIGNPVELIVGKDIIMPE